MEGFWAGLLPALSEGRARPAGEEPRPGSPIHAWPQGILHHDGARAQGGRSEGLSPFIGFHIYIFIGSEVFTVV